MNAPADNESHLSDIEKTWERVRTDEELRSFVSVRFAALPDNLEVE